MVRQGVDRQPGCHRRISEPLVQRTPDLGLRNVVTYWKCQTSREEGSDADVVFDLRQLLSDISRSGQADVAARAKDVHIRLGRIPFLSA